MKSLAISLGTALALLVVLASPTWAQTNVSGPISSNTNWTLADSPYIVIGGVLVNTGVTLTIDPGVEVRFNSGLSLQIDGELVAMGTEADTIIFTSNQGSPASGDWGYILFTDNSTDATYDIDSNYVSGSILKYCIVEYTGGSNGAVRVESSSPFISHSVIRINSHTGIYIKDDGSPTISNCVIRNNSNSGIYLFGGSSQIIDNEICLNYTSSYGGGISTSSPTTKIIGNYIHHNWADGGGGGISIGIGGYGGNIEGNVFIANTSAGNGGGVTFGDKYYNIINNIFIGNSAANEGGAIFGTSRYIVLVDGNIIANNTASGNTGGIRLNNHWGSYNADYRVKNNTIVGNTCDGWGAGGLYVSAYGGSATIKNNNVVGNITEGSCGFAVHADNSTANGNNIYGNTPLDLANANSQGTPNVNATNCWWGTTSDSEIQETIYDWFDNSSRGIVDYFPFLTSPDTIAPPIPPADLDTLSIWADSVAITWQPSPIGDLAGYRVYFDSDSSGYHYSDTVDVGFNTSYTFTSLMPGVTYYTAVTCYDNSGNESWYSREIDVSTGGAQGPQIAYGTYLEDSISFLGEINSYTFDGIAGQHVTVRVDFSDNAETWLEIYSPADTQLIERHSSSGAQCDIIDYELPDDGRYTIYVQETQGDELCSYWLNLNCRESELPGAPHIAYDAYLEDSISNNGDIGEIDAYTFDGFTGQHVTVRVDFSDNAETWLEIYSPADTQLIERHSSSGAQCDIVDYELPDDGRYTIYVQETQGDELCSYWLNLNCRESELPGAPHITYGTYLEDSISNNGNIGEIDAYTFDGFTGERVTLRVNFSDNAETWLEIYSPADTQLIERHSSSGAQCDIVDYELPDDGGYTIYVQETEGDELCSYWLTLNCANPQKPVISCPGGPIEVETYALGEVCIDLLISGADNVSSSYGNWSDNILCFDADSFGVYQPVIIAANTSGADTCQLTVHVSQLSMTVDTLWIHNWEFGLGSWYVDNGIWQVGTPTSGPWAAYSPSNCAATVLTGDYPSYANSRLISPEFTVPNQSENPRLRFWHWFHTHSYNDHGVVQILPSDSTNWQTISISYIYSGGGWTCALIDLQEFAGQAVRIGLQFQSDYGYEEPGWYVDDIWVETGPYGDLASTPKTFEDGLGDWKVSRGLWQVDSTANGDYMAGTVFNGDYPGDAGSSLSSPWFTVPSVDKNPRLRFWHFFDTHSYNDYGVVQILPRDSAASQELSPHYFHNSGALTRTLIDLQSYAGQEVMLKFSFYSDYGYHRSGWYLDDILIETGEYEDLASTPKTFDNGLGDWNVSRGLWQVDSTLGGDYLAGTVFYAEYPGDANSSLSSPWFTVPSAYKNPRLRFWHYFNTHSYNDYGVVQILARDSASAQIISPQFYGNSGGETRPLYELDAYADQEVKVIFSFFSDYGYHGPGWFVDDIVIETDCPTIYCYADPIDRTINQLGEPVCLELQIEGETTVEAGNASWSNDTLCFVADAIGTYAYTVIANNGFCADTCEVMLDVYLAQSDTVVIALSSENLVFETSEDVIVPPDPQMIYVGCPCDPGTLDWTAVVEKGDQWLEIAPTTGTNPETVEVSIKESALPIAAGIYNGLITFYDDAASNSPVYVNVSLFVESGINVGDYIAEAGTTFRVPINLHTTDSLANFTLPLKLKTMQPDMVKLDSVIFDPLLIDSVINVTDSEIVFQPIQPPPIPDDTTVVLGYAKFLVDAAAAPEEFYFDTTTVTHNEITYAYQFVKATGDTIVPGFDQGVYQIGNIPTLALTIDDVTCPQGDMVGIQVTAVGINNVGGLQLSISYDPVVVRTDSAVVSSDYFTATINDTTGVVYIAWANPSNPFSVPDEGTLMTLWFTGIGDAGAISSLAWTGNNILGSPDGNPIANIQYNDGSMQLTEQSGIFSGKIDYYSQTRSISDVVVDLTGTVSGSAITDSEGWYTFDGLSDGEYVIAPSYSANDPGVDILDAILIMNELAGIVDFSPYQSTAADVNLDCQVKIADVVKVLRKITMIEDFPRDWSFVESAFAIDNGNWCTAPDSITETMAGSSSLDLHFHGIRKGDVNGDWSPQGAAFAKTVYVEGSQVILTIDEAGAAEDGSISIPVTISCGNNVAGLELHLKYDSEQLDFAGAISDVMPGLLANAESDEIHIAWVDIEKPIQAKEKTVAIRLNFRHAITENEPMSIAFDKAIAADEQGRQYRVALSDGTIITNAIPDQFRLEQNCPNPFNPMTRISFSLAAGSNARLEVINILGQRIVILIDSYLEAGVHSAIWDGRDESGSVVASGIYFYRIRTDRHTACKKMVLLK